MIEFIEICPGKEFIDLRTQLINSTTQYMYALSSDGEIYASYDGDTWEQTDVNVIGFNPFAKVYADKAQTIEIVKISALPVENEICYTGLSLDPPAIWRYDNGWVKITDVELPR